MQSGPKPPELLDWNGEFFSRVRRNNTNEDGSIKNKHLQRRMSNEICRRCQDNYKAKFPNQPFQVDCEGIHSEADFQGIAKATTLPYEDVRETLDIPYWAERHIKTPDQHGNMVPFKSRSYQKEALLCTARKQVDRWGRGLGKTSTAIIKELHILVHRNKQDTLVACPMKAQAQKWFDELNQVIDNDPYLKEMVVQRRQAPYFTIRLSNGSKINIFTTGSKSGSKADSIRSQSPSRVRIDEQDLLTADEWPALQPLLDRYSWSEFAGSSTPLGKREKFWEMCTQLPNYRELYFPITVHPMWSPEMEERIRREARTEINYTHEYLAEFGDLEGGLFGSDYIDASKQDYLYIKCKRDKDKIYALGVDWNGQGTGTRLRVVEYDPATQKRRCVDHSAIHSSQLDSIEEIKRLNREWKCNHVFVDAGFGYVQDELLRAIGYTSENSDDRRLRDVQVVDFGAKLETNRLVPKRGLYAYVAKQELERPTKPFMVEGLAMVLEAGLFEFSSRDKILEDQLRAYRVKTYTKGGWANTYISDVGDHDLDALMLAMLAIETHYGLTRSTPFVPIIQAVHLNGFGSQAEMIPDPVRPENWVLAPSDYKSVRSAAQDRTKTPSRQEYQSPYSGLYEGRTVHVSRDMHGTPRSILHTPGQQKPTNSGNAVPSRTGGLKGGRGGTGPYKGGRR